MKPHFNQWDPRVGFAWDVTGDGRTAVRAGAGISHDYINTPSPTPRRITVPFDGESPAGRESGQPVGELSGR